MWIKSTSFNVWVRYFAWNFKGTLWNSTQNILPIHWKIWFLCNFEILRALRFKSSYLAHKCFWNTPQVLINSSNSMPWEIAPTTYSVITNRALYTGIFPQKIKVAKIQPFLKKKKKRNKDIHNGSKRRFLKHGLTYKQHNISKDRNLLQDIIESVHLGHHARTVYKDYVTTLHNTILA